MNDTTQTVLVVVLGFVVVFAIVFGVPIRFRIGPGGAEGETGKPPRKK